MGCRDGGHRRAVSRGGPRVNGQSRAAASAHPNQRLAQTHWPERRRRPTLGRRPLRATRARRDRDECGDRRRRGRLRGSTAPSARQEHAPVRPRLLRGRDRRVAGHDRLHLELRGADVHVDARARPAVRPAVRAADVGDGRRVRARGRPVPLDAAGVGTRGRGARGRPVLDHEPALARRLARVPGHRGVEQQPHEDRGGLGVGLRLQARVHLDRDPRRDHLAQARQVDPDDRRVREDRPRRHRVRDGRHLRRRARHPRLRRGRLLPDARGLPRRAFRC